MKKNPAVRMVALAAMLVCLFAFAPAAALASSAHNSTAAGPQASAATVDTGGSFSNKDLVILIAGAGALVAFGVGFRRISAPLE